MQDFAKFDINGNGALEGDECTRMARFQLGDKATDEAVEALIQEMDRNNDNRIELSEYMSKILGEDYQVIPDGDERVMGKQYCKLGEMQAKADEIYKNGSIPLICGSDDDLATALSTFWSYKVLCPRVRCQLSAASGRFGAAHQATCWYPRSHTS